MVRLDRNNIVITTFCTYLFAKPLAWGRVPLLLGESSCSLHALQGVAITGVLDLRELVALVVVVAAHESFSVRSNLDILLEVLEAFVRAVDADEVVVCCC